MNNAFSSSFFILFVLHTGSLEISIYPNPGNKPWHLLQEKNVASSIFLRSKATIS